MEVDRAVPFKPLYAHWRTFLSCKKICDGSEYRAVGDGEWLETFSRLRRCKTLGGGDARERLEAVRVWLLGGFRIAVDSRTLRAKQWRLRKAVDLVKVLALAPKHRLPRERAIELLWPGFGKEAASNNLRQTLHAIRKAFDAVGGSRYLASEEGRSYSARRTNSGSMWRRSRRPPSSPDAPRVRQPTGRLSTSTVGSYSPMTPMRSGRRRDAKRSGSFSRPSSAIFTDPTLPPLGPN